MFRSPPVLFAIVNLPFLFIFYDQFNLNSDIYSFSYMAIGLNPFHYNSAVVAGYTLSPYYLLAYYLYGLLGFQELAVAAVLKLVALMFTYLGGYLLWKVARAEGYVHPKVILYSFILNPFILLVDDVWVETDAIVMFLIILGYVLIYYGWHRNGNFASLALGAACIVWCVFSYYFLVVLLPTLILYRHGTRNKLTTIGVMLLFLAAFAIPVLEFGLFSSYVSQLGSGSVGVTVYSTFNLVTPESGGFIASASVVSLALIVVGSVFIPVYFKHAKLVEPLSLLATLSFAFAMTVSSLQGDNFILLIGLLLLSVIFVRGSAVTYARIFLLQVFLLPQMFIVQLFNGPGVATGFFYWSYYQFHCSIALYAALGDWGMFLWKLSLLVYLLTLGAAVAYVVHMNLRHNASTRPRPEPSSYSVSAAAPYAKDGAWTAVSVLAIVTVVLLIVSAYLTPQGTIGHQVISSSRLGSDYFTPYDYGQGSSFDYVLESPQSFLVNPDNSSVYFSAASLPVGLFRNVSDQAFSMQATANALFGQNTSVSTTMNLVDTPNFTIGLATALAVNSSMGLEPENSSDYSTVRSGSSPVFYGSTEVYSLNGTGVLVYNLSPASLATSTAIFGLDVKTYGPVQNMLWAMSIGGIGYEAFLHDGSFYLGYTVNGSWVFVISPFDITPGEWFASGLSVDLQRTTLNGFVNDVMLSVPFYGTGLGNTTLYVGKFNTLAGSDYQFATSGNFTTLYSIPKGYNVRDRFAYISTSTGEFTPAPYVKGVAFDLTQNDTESTVTLEGRSEAFPTSQQLWIGKLSPSPTAVYVTFSQISISSVTRGISLQVVAVSFSILLPSTVLSSYASIRKGPRDRTPPTTQPGTRAKRS